MKRHTWKTVALMLTLASVEANAAIDLSDSNPVAVCDNVGKYISQRPKESNASSSRMPWKRKSRKSSLC